MDKQEYEKIFQQLPYIGPLGEAADIPRLLLTKCLLQLPESVREFTLRHCLFTTIPLYMKGITYQAFLPEQVSNLRNFYLIVLWEYLDMSEFTIAHEVAHAYMDELRSYPKDIEAEADRLAMEWGFQKPAEG